MNNQNLPVDLPRIKFKKVKHFLITNSLTTTSGFRNLKSVCFNPLQSGAYSHHLKTFLLKKDIQTVWNTYKNIHPRDTSMGKMVSFGVGYCKKQDQIIYPNSHFAGIEPGQIIILNLNIFNLLTIAVAHEVGEVNEAEKYIKLCYTQHGKAEGSQWIRLVTTPEGDTEVRHETFYKSDSVIRDKYLYPLLHEKAITEFHESVRKKLSHTMGK